MIPNPLDYPRWLEHTLRRRVWNGPTAEREVAQMVRTVDDALAVLETSPSLDGLEVTGPPLDVEQTLAAFAIYSGQQDLVSRAAAEPSPHRLTSAAYWSHVESLVQVLSGRADTEESAVETLFGRVMRHPFFRPWVRTFVDVLRWTDHRDAVLEFGPWAEDALRADGVDPKEDTARIWFPWPEWRQGFVVNAALTCQAIAKCAMTRDAYSLARFTAVRPRRNPERLRGGRADALADSDFDPDELARGTEHELEHTSDRKVAREIAKDHLAEDRNYYSKLEAMEDIDDAELRDIFAEQDARAAAKRAFGELVWEEFERSGIVVLRAKDIYPGMRVSLTRSTYPGVAYQVTRWEGEEPTGHLDAQSQKSAVDELWFWAGEAGWRERWEKH